MIDSSVGDVMITVPSQTQFIKTVRLAVSGVASLGSFSVDLIDDLKVAVDEMCSTLIEVGDGEGLSLTISMSRPDVMRITGRTGVGDPTQLDQVRADLSQQILDVMADDHDFTMENGIATFWCERSADPLDPR